MTPDEILEFQRKYPSLQTIGQPTVSPLPTTPPVPQVRIHTVTPKPYFGESRDQMTISYSHERERFEALLSTGRGWKLDHATVKDLGFKYDVDFGLWHIKRKKTVAILIKFCQDSAKEALGSKLLETASSSVNYDPAEALKVEQHDPEYWTEWLLFKGWKQEDLKTNPYWYDPIDILADPCDKLSALMQQKDRDREAEKRDTSDKKKDS